MISLRKHTRVPDDLRKPITDAVLAVQHSHKERLHEVMFSGVFFSYPNILYMPTVVYAYATMTAISSFGDRTVTEHDLETLWPFVKDGADLMPVSIEDELLAARLRVLTLVVPPQIGRSWNVWRTSIR